MVVSDEEPDLVALFSQAKPEDLERVRARIEQKAKEAADVAAAYAREIDGLKAIAAALDVRLNGKPERKRPGPKKKAQPAEGINGNGLQVTIKDRQRLVIETLKRHGGSMVVERLAEAAGISRFGMGSLANVLKSDLFHTNPNGLVTLTSKGDREAARL